MDSCVFCEIVNGSSPANIVWEDTNHMAFLSIFPNTDGFTVVITKKHYSSYYFDHPDKILNGLILASKKVAGKIDKAFDGVGRTGLILEGFGVDHLHAKLFPMHGTKGSWQKKSSNINKFFQKYEGYISSHDYKRENEKKLAVIASKIRKTKA
ncbi:HIT family protein [Candidatus Curtissbacteria bacterium]|nr:HIT family protein [Candidatus Curtissbacteria bacterium]